MQFNVRMLCIQYISYDIFWPISKKNINKQSGEMLQKPLTIQLQTHLMCIQPLALCILLRQILNESTFQHDMQ